MDDHDTVGDMGSYGCRMFMPLQMHLVVNSLYARCGLCQVSWITHTDEVYNLSINDD